MILCLFIFFNKKRHQRRGNGREGNGLLWPKNRDDWPQTGPVDLVSLSWSRNCQCTTYGCSNSDDCQCVHGLGRRVCVCIDTLGRIRCVWIWGGQGRGRRIGVDDEQDVDDINHTQFPKETVFAHSPRKTRRGTPVWKHLRRITTWMIVQGGGF